MPTDAENLTRMADNFRVVFPLAATVAYEGGRHQVCLHAERNPQTGARQRVTIGIIWFQHEHSKKPNVILEPLECTIAVQT